VSAERTSIHGQWSGRLAFILAASGSAIGLGNIWKFPYIAGKYGGGAFVLVYLICIAVIGIPIMMAEVMLGRRGRQSPINTMRTLAAEEYANPHWQWLGWGGVVAGFLILSYYSVVAGEALAYVFRTGAGLFDGATADGVRTIFARFVSDPEHLLAWHTIFMGMTMIVVARGVRSGLERAVRFMMPALLVILLVLVGYAMNTSQFGNALAFMFKPDFHHLFYAQDASGNLLLDAQGQHIFTWNAVLVALGHAFFTLSLGMGAIMVYGSYLRKDASIAKTTLIIAIMDTVVALLAGLAIFPLVFANNLAPGTGSGLIFETLPIAFGHMPGGAFFGCLFFILLVFAAWTSAISLMEPAVTWLVENRGHSRVHAVVLVGVLIWLLGIASVFSAAGVTLRDIVTSVAAAVGIHDLELPQRFFSLSAFGLIDYLTANIMLPLGGLLTALFAGWAMREQATREELGIRLPGGYTAWRIMIRYVTPVAVILVFLNVVGAFDWVRRWF